MKSEKLKIEKNLEKYYRWGRRFWHRAYMKTVRILEKELGGELRPC